MRVASDVGSAEGSAPAKQVIIPFPGHQRQRDPLGQLIADVDRATFRAPLMVDGCPRCASAAVRAVEFDLASATSEVTHA